ncbi:MAG: DUF4852 domain-containing protein [Micavibrio sp.]
MYRFFAVFLVAIFLMSGFSFFASAQDAPADPETYRGVESQELNKYASDDDLEIKDGYGIPTFKNLSKLYWALAMFDLGDDVAIDNYLMINECDLYRKYFSSDFEFESLRAATKETIVKNMASFPVKFEIMIPVGLDRYDTGTEKFKLDPRSHFIGSKRLEVYVNDVGAFVCGKNRSDIPGYPKNFILTLSRPFTLTEVPVPPELAQFYIEESQKLAQKYSYRYTISKHGRVAYVRLKVTMNQFRGYSKQTGQAPMADIFGTIDGFDLYADRDKTLLLYSQIAEAKKVYRRKKASKADPAPEQDEPAPVEPSAAPASAPNEAVAPPQQP